MGAGIRGDILWNMDGWTDGWAMHAHDVVAFPIPFPFFSLSDPFERLLRLI